MKGLIKRFLKDEEGASAVEYGVLVALIIAACVIIIVAVGQRVNNAFNRVVQQLPAGT